MERLFALLGVASFLWAHFTFAAAVMGPRISKRVSELMMPHMKPLSLNMDASKMVSQMITRTKHPVEAICTALFVVPIVVTVTIPVFLLGQMLQLFLVIVLVPIC